MCPKDDPLGERRLDVIEMVEVLRALGVAPQAFMRTLL